MQIGDRFQEQQRLPKVLRGYLLGDSLLVSQDRPGRPWEVEDEFEGTVEGSELVARYGLWQDRELTAGGGPDPVVLRPRNGLVEDDEVASFKLIALERRLVPDQEGNLNLVVRSDMRIRPEERSAVLDTEWLVLSQQPTGRATREADSRGSASCTL